MDPVLSSETFLAWLESVHRRTVRDVSSLPPEAATWRPAPVGDAGEAWGIPELVAHLAEARGYFADAATGRGWVWKSWPVSLPTQADWIAALEESFASCRVQLAAGLDPSRRVSQIGDPARMVSAWRVCMMLAEHEIAHRAQIATYAGLNGWPVPQLFGRDNAWVRAQRDLEQARRED